ncbi:MAG: alpha/beta hydrolase [Candidatus Hydrogenedentes bacterium]|nr:alpha/beta hydrolase [Candidatus Hydrogenedentota bacterium]
MNNWLPWAREHFADLPGLRMHYMTAGPDGGEPVLLLHGFPEFWYSWRFQMEALAAAGYRVIVPDQRGYNLTDKQGPYDLGTLVQDLIHLVDHLGLEKCHVAGHDWGGVTAWGFAALFPARTNKLITMNGPHPAAYLDACKRSRQVFRSWYIFYFQIPAVPEWSLRRNDYQAIRDIFRLVPREQMSDEDIDRYVEAMAQPGALTAAISWYRGLPKLMLRGKKQLPKIAAPTCVIWGERDHALDKACNDTLAQYVPDLLIHYVPEGTHWVQMVRPRETNQFMLEFLKG